jgi:hypothetical protein
MLRSHPLITSAGLSILIVMISAIALADDINSGNWRRGRVYYRLVCTSCHKAENGQAISPSEFSIAEWNAIIDNDKHAPSGNANPSIRYYVSRAYREWVKNTNKAAKKFLEVPEQELLNDLHAFVVRGAKDSDTPIRCK